MLRATFSGFRRKLLVLIFIGRICVDIAVGLIIIITLTLFGEIRKGNRSKKKLAKLRRCDP